MVARRRRAVLALVALAAVLASIGDTSAAFTGTQVAGTTVTAGRLAAVVPVSCTFPGTGGQQVSWQRAALAAGQIAPTAFTVSVAGYDFDSADYGGFTGFSGGGYAYTYDSTTGVYRLYNSTPDWSGSVDFTVTPVYAYGGKKWAGPAVTGTVAGTTKTCTWPKP